MTPEQKEQQRQSFACGNAKIDNPHVTREMVEQPATIKMKLGWWRRRDGGVERLIKEYDYDGYNHPIWENQHSGQWASDGCYVSGCEHFFPDAFDLIEYLGPLEAELKIEAVSSDDLPRGRMVRKTTNHSELEGVLLGYVEKLNGRKLAVVECNAPGANGIVHLCGENQIEVCGEVIPDPLAEYSEDELTVAKAILSGELEITSRVTRVFRYREDWLCCIGDCDRSAVYASAMFGPWPLGDEPCNIDMTRVRSAVAIMREVK